MSAKRLILISAILGSTLGGCAPALWHASVLSLSGMVTSTLGGLLGIWVAWRVGQRYM